MTKEQIKEFRVKIDACIQMAENNMPPKADQNPPIPEIRELSIVRTKLQEAKMWAGKCLEAIGSEFPEEYRDKAE